MAEKQSGVVVIHGREYETVALRVRKFRDAHPDWTLFTNIIERNEDGVVMCATIFDESGRIRATGHAEEQRKASQINRTSALENCETSAIGRCLAALGMGGTEFATAEEVANAIHQQSKSGIHKPTDGAMDRVAAERQKVIVDTATQVVDALKDGREFDAYSLCETLTEADEKVALWSMLTSKQRSAIKSQSTQAKETT